MIVRKYATASAVVALMLTVIPLSGQSPSNSELYAIHQIREEGFADSKVMEIISYLSDVYGPRLTNSPIFFFDATWTTERLNEWKLAHVALERWGPFGRGWSNERTSVQ